MRKYFFITIILFLPCYVVYGQISAEEEPISFRINLPALRTSEKTVKSFASLDMSKIEQEDIEDEANGIPPRFGYKYEVSYNLDNSGEWTELADGSKMWRLVISCQGALSINLLYDEFWLPDGAKFFVYSNDRRHSIGAFTSANNNGDRNDIQGFATGLVYGDQVTLEYWLPNEVKEMGVISLAYVVHGYRYILLPDNLRNYGDSGDCNVNVNCTPEGQNWQNEKNAIAMILVNGNRYCTGSLVNTTANDNRPLFLTADHCLGGWANDYVKYDAVTHNSPNLTHWSFYWHYESPTCTNAVPTTRSTTGAQLVANDSISDFALLDLSGANSDPRNRADVTPYYLGWDRSGNAGTGGVSIHHPSGDIKKISTYTMTPQSAAYSSNTVNANENHWRVVWVQTSTNPFRHGITEGGSSGSPLINSNRRIIGQLHGGYADCVEQAPYGKNEPDWYGKFSVSWTGNNNDTIQRRLNHWLDPLGTAPSTLDGMGEPAISGPTLICSNATFTVYYAPPGFTWDKSSNLSLSSTTSSSITVSATNSNGAAGWLSVKDSSGTEVLRKDVWVGPPVVTIDGPEDICTCNCYDAGYHYYASVTNSLSKPQHYVWNVSPYFSNNCDFGNSDSEAVCSFIPFPLNYVMSARAYNTCGYGPYTDIEIITWCSSASPSIYPNPASHTLNIEIVPQANNNSAGNSGPIYDIRLYDVQGNLLRQTATQGGKVEFNVSNLPDGIYYLHVYEGKGRKAEIRQIIIEH